MCTGAQIPAYTLPDLRPFTFFFPSGTNQGQCHLSFWAAWILSVSTHQHDCLYLWFLIVPLFQFLIRLQLHRELFIEQYLIPEIKKLITNTSKYRYAVFLQTHIILFFHGVLKEWEHLGPRLAIFCHHPHCHAGQEDGSRGTEVRSCATWGSGDDIQAEKPGAGWQHGRAFCPQTSALMNYTS